VRVSGSYVGWYLPHSNTLWSVAAQQRHDTGCVHSLAVCDGCPQLAQKRADVLLCVHLDRVCPAVKQREQMVVAGRMYLDHVSGV
jgi:hypothetical protein